jgi:hypothetical protein
MVDDRGSRKVAAGDDLQVAYVFCAVVLTKKSGYTREAVVVKGERP